MKVLCSNPPWWIENPDGIHTPKLLAGVRAGSRWPFTTAVRSHPDHFVFGDSLPYPFFLGAAATYLARTTGAAVAFRDSIALREGYPAYFRYLKEEDFDYVVLESAATSWEHDAALIREIKRRHPRCKLVLTGPIAVRGESLLAEHPLHAVVQGEYEKGCARVVEGAEGLLAHDLLTEEELDAAPGPWFDMAHAYRYWDGRPKGLQAPQLQIMSSRGCPFKCIFCAWPAVMSNNDPDGTGQRRVRHYSADHMEGVLTDLVGRYGFKSVSFGDDTFNLDDRHVLSMCDVMERLGLPWSAMCRADTIARDTWKRMRESGCFGVKLGFESGNQWVVDNIVRKDLDLNQARETVTHLKELGFTVHGTFTLGLPGETPEHRAETVRYRQSLPLDSFQESDAAEIEGTPLASLRRAGKPPGHAGASPEEDLGERDGTQKRRHAPRLIVLDHGMHFVAGHHLAYNLGLLIECIKRGLPADFYVHAECNPEVVKVLRGYPVLSPSPYVSQSQDRYCGYLEDFIVASKMVEANLSKNLHGKFGPDDIVYVHTAKPKIVMGIAAWYGSLAKENRPHLCLKFQNHGYRYVEEQYRALTQAVFRMALKPFIGLDKVHFAASNRMIAAQIRPLAEKPCPVFPIPLQLDLPPRRPPRPGEPRELRIGYAGEGRSEQGVDLLPDIIETILPAYPNARFVIQLGCPFARERTMQRLRAFGDRVEVLEKCYVADQFHALLQSFDALLLPYEPGRYIERSSQVVIEAIALGVPLIVPARTSLALEAKTFDCGAAFIHDHTVPAVAKAVASFLDHHEALTAKSRAAAPRCAGFHSAATLVDMLLDLTDGELAKARWGAAPDPARALPWTRQGG